MRIDLTMLQYFFYIGGSILFLLGSLIGTYIYAKGL